MRKLFHFCLLGAAMFVACPAFAQAVDPDVRGPARRAAAAAGNALGTPGVENRIERREQQRDLDRAANSPNPDVRANSAARAEARANPDQWRYKYHNNQWWYYTPQNRWMYYSNNAWSPYDATTYRAPRRYSTGYRGTYNNGAYYNNGRYYNGRYDNRRYYDGSRGAYGPATTPYSNGTPAGNAGSNLGAEIGGAIGGATGANTGAAIGGAIGNPIGAGERNTPPVDTRPVPVPVPTTPPAASP